MKEQEKGRWLVGVCRLVRGDCDAPEKQWPQRGKEAVVSKAEPNAGWNAGMLECQKQNAQCWLSEARMQPPPSGRPWNVVLQGPYHVDIERCWCNNCVAGGSVRRLSMRWAVTPESNCWRRVKQEYQEETVCKAVQLWL